ncbi:paraben-hydrolyzing esterase precursor [Massarina eburnea CBS 473.64]|uniref:Carboxylic ester hydrolase n=1 Tax=Massarina eburnea CBS 473.64 TaxID=1395130 RepID=A0A6A6S8R5_9PLEO|nr:paraben-hydrolyzing esterase precursor [Massarina eburnea CBS 473.64]
MTITTTITRPHLIDLQERGFIEAATYHDYATDTDLCHYVGGLPYALPPIGPFRFQRPRPLPAYYRYGTQANPGRFIGATGLCPQPQPGEDTSADWDEDCLQVNIWIPTGRAPAAGWPVIVWYHGGFLQFGSPTDSDFSNLLSDTNAKAIIVTPAYRLNIFGFLASKELAQQDHGVEFSTNNGFWDQRLALEWTWKNIHYFGGDAGNITIGGYSAGSHSAFHQLAYELGQPDEEAIVRRALMFSNGPGVQPKSLDEAQLQFDELVSILGLPSTMTVVEKLAVLRTLSPKILIDASAKMRYHEFRGVTDGSFIRHGLMGELDSGKFAEVMKRRNIKLMTGECRDEHFVYGTWHTPENSYNSVLTRLQADYPLEACTALMHYYFPNRQHGHRYKDWQDAFGHMYADIQIHHLERGMVNALVNHGAGDLIYRYRVEWRAQCCDKQWPREWGVTHGTDAQSIWFWGGGERLSNTEKTLVRTAFHDLFANFVKGEQVNWGTAHALQLRTMKPDGSVVVEEDPYLVEGVKVWNVLKSAGVTATDASSPSSSSLPSNTSTIADKERRREEKEEYTNVKALYDFHRAAHTELTFRAGDIIQVVRQDESGWWDGVKDGVRGWIPSNYVRAVEEKARL